MLTIAAVLMLPVARVSVLLPLASSPTLPTNEAEQVIQGLLYNSYRAFDHHDKSVIYDRLSHSVSGALLSDIYLQTRKSMELKNQGGLRVSVKNVNLMELEPIACAKNSQSCFRCRWQAMGSVGHWGHVHQRTNEHLAHLGVSSQDGNWKITSLELLSQGQIETPGESELSNQEFSE